jgi:hypothetical protein
MDEKHAQMNEQNETTVPNQQTEPQINAKWTNKTDENSSTEWMNRMRRQWTNRM